VSEDDRRLRDAERKIGELTMENEIWRAVAQKRHLCVSSAHSEGPKIGFHGPEHCI
jgi:hypothetical protein